MSSITIIGITCRYDYGAGQECSDCEKKRCYHSAAAYAESVKKAGGTPILIPPIVCDEMVQDLMRICDGFVFSGGGYDVIYGNEKSCAGTHIDEHNPCRIKFEKSLAHTALKNDKPILGTCLGHQIINEALGGTLTKDITSFDIRHAPEIGNPPTRHAITIDEGTQLHSILGVTELEVNSYHEQAVEKIGDGLVVTARSSDNVIEAFESPNHSFVVGVQFHPEALVCKNELFLKLFVALVHAARK